MINYKKIQDAIDREEDLAMSIGASDTFLDAVDLLQEGVDLRYDENEWFAVLREIRHNHFGRARGEMKSILDNLLTRVLDIVSFG
tara:strand:+ start:311 stop:565 length:255 start_codon:yes stop_codon:yes gene_type:complete